MAATTKFMTNPPRVKAFHLDGTSLANATWTRVTWSAADGSDYEAMRGGTGITMKADGRYQVSFCVAFAGNATGFRWAQVRKNSAGSVSAGTDLFIDRRPPQSSGTTTFVTATADVPALVSGDVLELFAYQSSGAGLALNTGASQTWMSVRWVALD